MEALQQHWHPRNPTLKHQRGIPVCIFEDRAGEKAHPHPISLPQDPLQDSCTRKWIHSDDDKQSQNREYLSKCLWRYSPMYPPSRLKRSFIVRVNRCWERERTHRFNLSHMLNCARGVHKSAAVTDVKYCLVLLVESSVIILNDLQA